MPITHVELIKPSTARQAQNTLVPAGWSDVNLASLSAACLNVRGSMSSPSSSTTGPADRHAPECPIMSRGLGDHGLHWSMCGLHVFQTAATGTRLDTAHSTDLLQVVQPLHQALAGWAADLLLLG